MRNFYLVEAQQETDIMFHKEFWPRGEVVTCRECKYRQTSECWANRLFTCDSDFCSRGVKKDEILADKG